MMHADWQPVLPKMEPLSGSTKPTSYAVFSATPLHRVCINSNWLSSTVRVLAQEICDNRSLLNHSLDQSLFPILADALEETGCEKRRPS